MKISELPPKSKAVKSLRRLEPSARRERLRCAEEALTILVIAKNLYPDESAQWIRAEQVLKGILRDYMAKHEWILERRSKRSPR